MASLNYAESVGEGFPGVLAACSPISLPAGMIVGPDTQFTIPGDQYLISPYCPLNSVYIFDINRVFGKNTRILTADTPQWRSVYYQHDGYASSMPVFLSVMSIALGLVVSMGFVMTISRHSRFPWMLRIAVYYACALVIAIFGRMLNFCRLRFKEGGNCVALVVDYMLEKGHQVPAYIGNVMLLFSLARVSERLFERGVERKVVMHLAPIIVTVSLAITGVSMFGKSVSPILNAIRYLFELSVYLLFSVCLCLRVFEEWQAAFLPEMVPLTVATVLVSWMPCALYIADTYGWWQARIIDELCPFSVVCCVVVGWIWVQKLNDTRQLLADQRQLGRRIYSTNNQPLEERSEVHDATAWQMPKRLFDALRR